MLGQLRAADVEVLDRVEGCKYGRFGWAVDPEGNRFALRVQHHPRVGISKSTLYRHLKLDNTVSYSREMEWGFQ